MRIKVPTRTTAPTESHAVSISPSVTEPGEMSPAMPPMARLLNRLEPSTFPMARSGSPRRARLHAGDHFGSGGTQGDQREADESLADIEAVGQRTCPAPKRNSVSW